MLMLELATVWRGSVFKANSPSFAAPNGGHFGAAPAKGAANNYREARVASGLL